MSRPALAGAPATPVAIALGSNVGDREAHLGFAVQRLGAVLGGLRASRWYETAPVGGGDQPTFLNGVVVGTTALPADRLLALLQAIEADRGRTRSYMGAPRTLDLDLILYGTRVIVQAGLVVPHPRFRDRAFVLRPLADLEPGWRDPVTGKTVQALLDRLGKGEAGREAPGT